MEHKRQIWSAIEPYTYKKMGRILVLTGARQVGKTTLVKKKFDDYEYISVEDPDMRYQLASSQSAGHSRQAAFALFRIVE